MTGQNKRVNTDKNKEISTYIAFGDPVNNTPPAINEQKTKATTTIADSTQNVRSGRINSDTKKHDTSAYGDPIIATSTFNTDEYEKANSTIAKSTHTKNQDSHT